MTPTTSRIGLIRHGPTVGREVTSAGLEVITAPVDLLREINIVDTPGTNAVRREHEALTREFVPRSDLVLFVTSADRPFTESERAFLQSIRDWGKKIVVVLNKVDIFEQEAQVAEVVTFISDSARALLGFTPEVFPVSGRQALRAKEAGDAAALAGSGFDRLEQFIAETLDETERVRLKLLNPLGVGLALLDRHLSQTEERLGLLKDDFAAIEEIDSQLKLYREDLARDFRFRLADVDECPPRFREARRRFLRGHAAHRPGLRPHEPVANQGGVRAQGGGRPAAGGREAGGRGHRLAGGKRHAAVEGGHPPGWRCARRNTPSACWDACWAPSSPTARASSRR